MADLDPNAFRDITFDVTTLTLGEAAAAEAQSGMTIGQIAKGRASLRLLALFVHELRTSGAPHSWAELSNLRLLDVSSSTTPTQPAEASRTSPD